MIPDPPLAIDPSPAEACMTPEQRWTAQIEQACHTMHENCREEWWVLLPLNAALQILTPYILWESTSDEHMDDYRTIWDQGLQEAERQGAKAVVAVRYHPHPYRPRVGMAQRFYELCLMAEAYGLRLRNNLILDSEGCVIPCRLPRPDPWC